MIPRIYNEYYLIKPTLHYSTNYVHKNKVLLVNNQTNKNLMKQNYINITLPVHSFVALYLQYYTLHLAQL